MMAVLNGITSFFVNTAENASLKNKDIVIIYSIAV